MTTKKEQVEEPAVETEGTEPKQATKAAEAKSRARMLADEEAFNATKHDGVSDAAALASERDVMKGGFPWDPHREEK